MDPEDQINSFLGSYQLSAPSTLNNASNYSAFYKPMNTGISTPTSFGTGSSGISDNLKNYFADSTSATTNIPGVTSPDNYSVNLGGSTEKSGFFDDIFSDKYKMGNIVGLAGALTNLAALPTMLKGAKLANQTAQFNLDQAKGDVAFRKTQRDNINRPVSAFV